MSRRIIFKTKNLHYPSRCVVCQQEAGSMYAVQRTISHANRNVSVVVKVPMCAQHYSAAVKIGSRERGLRRAGLLLGGLTGALSLTVLLRLWGAPGQSITVLNLFVAALVAISLFMLIWSIFNFFIGPLLAGPDVVAARHSVRILRYWPRTGQIQLEFENEPAADAIIAANRDQVILAQ